MTYAAYCDKRICSSNLCYLCAYYGKFLCTVLRPLLVNQTLEYNRFYCTQSSNFTMVKSRSLTHQNVKKVAYG